MVTWVDSILGQRHLPACRRFLSSPRTRFVGYVRVRAADQVRPSLNHEETPECAPEARNEPDHGQPVKDRDQRHGQADRQPGQRHVHVRHRQQRARGDGQDEHHERVQGLQMYNALVGQTVFFFTLTSGQSVRVGLFHIFLSYGEFPALKPNSVNQLFTAQNPKASHNPEIQTP